RVPLIFAHASLAAGRRVPASVGLQDIARTICEVLGLAPDPALGGRSLAAALRGNDLESTPQYFENYATYYDFGWSQLLGVGAGGEKLIRAPRGELYRLRGDAGELENLLGDADQSPVLAQRVRELTSLLDGIVAGHPPHEGYSHEIDVTPSAREHLQALGYVGGGRPPPPPAPAPPPAPTPPAPPP